MYQGFDLTGSVFEYGGTTVPADSGWLMCNGQILNAVANKKYERLWNKIGTSFGGTGQSDFRVPDLRGIHIKGYDSAQANQVGGVQREASRAGGAVGANVGSYEWDHVMQHFHNIQMEWTRSVDNNHTAETTFEGSNVPTTYSGGNETRGKNLYMNHIIKY